MRIYQEMSLQDFKFWSGAKDRAEKLTDRQMAQIEANLMEVEPAEGWTDTAINDLFWFDFDTVVQWLGYEDEEHFDAGVSEEDVEDADSWFSDVTDDTDEMIEVAGLNEDDFMENDELDEDKVYDAFSAWWNGLTDIEQVQVMRKNS